MTATHNTLTPSHAAAAKPAVILVGLDDRGKPHASWFPVPKAAAARAAGGLMAMHPLDVINDDLRSLAKALPEGKVFESGRAFVPFVKRDTYDQLVSHLPKKAKTELEQAVVNAAANKAAVERAAGSVTDTPRPIEPISPGSLPTDWPKIIVRSIVLALDPNGGWWQAVVMEDKGDDLLVLIWREYDLPPFLRKRDQLALLPQNYRAV